MKRSLLLLLIFFFSMSSISLADRSHHNKHKGGIEWSIIISPYGTSIGIGSRGTGAGNVFGRGNYYYNPPPAMMYAPPRTPAYLPRPFCTNGNAYYFPDGAIIGNEYLPPGTTIPPGICYY